MARARLRHSSPAIPSGMGLYASTKRESQSSPESLLHLQTNIPQWEMNISSSRGTFKQISDAKSVAKEHCRETPKLRDKSASGCQAPHLHAASKYPHLQMEACFYPPFPLPLPSPPCHQSPCTRQSRAIGNGEQAACKHHTTPSSPGS